MDIQAISQELQTKMDACIDRLQKGTGDDAGAINGAASLGNQYTIFKKELYQTIFDLIEKNNLVFRNSEESKSFLEELKPTCEYLLNRYFVGS